MCTSIVSTASIRGEPVLIVALAGSMHSSRILLFRGQVGIGGKIVIRGEFLRHRQAVSVIKAVRIKPVQIKIVQVVGLHLGKAFIAVVDRITLKYKKETCAAIFGVEVDFDSIIAGSTSLIPT